MYHLILHMVGHQPRLAITDAADERVISLYSEGKYEADYLFVFQSVLQVQQEGLQSRGSRYNFIADNHMWAVHSVASLLSEYILLSAHGQWRSVVGMVTARVSE